jgi:pyruvate/2-oxoglutarate dehydrogenase complex dihydrolipoamide dehydrogenase (E3) component
MTKTTDSVYDLIVIGTGVAASTVAWKCHSAGWKIAVVDSRPFGGTCALRGCDPKIEWAIKALTILKIFISNGQN